jgi:hypothetical protein
MPQGRATPVRGTTHHTSPSSKTILSTILPHGDAAARDGYDAAMNSFHRQPRYTSGGERCIILEGE